jgi:tRNA(Ile)-lysidine synthase
MAMLALSHDWARHMGVGLWVVTVDHGLRPESAEEAAMVAAECAALGHPHATLRWRWDGQGNLQDAARRARLALIDRWRGDRACADGPHAG